MPMKRTPTQDRALAWYARHYNLKIQLSTHPMYYFFNDKQETVGEHIYQIVREWENEGRPE